MALSLLNKDRSQKQGMCYWKVYEEYVMRKGYLKLATNLAKLCSHSSFFVEGRVCKH